MKKKVFSLMMTLLLAITGIVRAQELTVHDGTTTNSYVPFYGLWVDDYTRSEMIYPASELSEMSGADITSLTFYKSSTNTNSWGTASFQVYLTEVGSTTLSAYIGMTGATVVYEGGIDAAGGEIQVTIDFTTPYHYNGGNLLVGIYETQTGSYSSAYWYGETVTGASASGYNASSPASATFNQRNFLPKTTFAYSGGSGGTTALHVMYMDGETQVIDELNMGTRPVNAWMEPFRFVMYNQGPAVTVSILDITPNDGTFVIGGEELPFTLARNEEVDLTLSTNATTSGLLERQFVAIVEGRAAHIWPLSVNIYDPEMPDVFELAYNASNETFPFVDVPVNRLVNYSQLHNDYTLPFPEIPEGMDAVYKLTFAQDQMLNAEVTYGDNGKVALYREDFNGAEGPMADNYYTGPAIGGASAGTPFEAQIGDGTSTLTYFPFHTLWNYSLAENLFLASELNEAGVTTAPMTSLSWYVSSMSTTTPQNNISIWMANVSDEALTTTSHTTAGMTLVYTGSNVLPVAGQWNEFEFNEGNFAWDGSSNILILCQRNNGSWQGSISWQTHNPGFAATSYAYNDNNPYDASTQTYSMSTSSTNRANIIMKSNGGRVVRDNIALEEGFESGAMPEGWTSEGTGTWSVGTGDYSTTTGAHTGTYNARRTHSTTGTQTYLVTPAMDLSGVTSGTLNFWYVNRSWAGDIDALGVYYRVNGGDWNQLFYTTDAHSAWTESGDIALTGFAANYQIGFLMVDNYGYGVGIDDVVINTVGGGSTPTPTPVLEGVSYGPVIENAPVEAGTYYLVASSTTPNFEVTINGEPMPCPTVDGFAFNPIPADDEDEVEPASVTLRWNIPAYATGWRLIFGTTYHPEANHPQTIIYPEDGSFSTTLANSFTVRNLFNNTNYFWRVEFNNEGACPNGVSSPVWGFTTHLNIPQNLTAVDYTVFDDEQIVLNWNAVADRTYRKYNVYRDGELIGSTAMNQINNTTYTDGPLAYNMGGYTYYVTAVYDEGESAPCDPVTVKVSGYGDVNGHVYEQDGTTGIAGATVTMVGLDEFGVNHTYNFTTNNQGYYSGHIYAGTYDGQAAKEGYQTMTEPVQGNPVVLVYNETTSPIDFILDENFDPVCAVIAEYYPDSLDPNSPYVKVYWGCGLPGSEIVEPFETGDFSLFDWQLDPTYPWTITTTNPYEGTYCMKSGGAGVANVISNMTVTVEIPADGIMSYFGKISCESNWDYGYFYIDGVQKGSYTGAGNWAEKTFDITAGEHTFMWQYTKDGSVNSNDDCFYVDYITFYKQPEPAIPGMTYDFENSTMQGWTSVDADGDGYGWYVASEIMSTGYGHNGSNDCVLSQSYNNSVGILYPDNYLVSPQVQLGGVIRFYACAQDASYAAEHFGVAVSTTNTNPSSFTMLQEWTMSAKSMGEGKPVTRNTRSGRAQGNWYEYTVDLSAYSGTGYVAIRHFNCSDMFYLDVDDITIGEPGKGMPSNDRAFAYYRVYRTDCYNDGPYTLDNTVLLASELQDTVYIDVEWADLAPGVYKWGVGVVYSGNRESEISWTDPISVNNAKGNRDEAYNFDDGMQGWTTIDADGDGLAWVSSMNPGVYHNSGVDLTGTGHNSSAHYVISGSYANGTGQALYPDNYLVSPQIALGGSITFYACAQDANYAAEHFGVAVSTTGNTSASAFTTIQEWTMTAKGGGGMISAGREGNNRAQGNWYQYTVDLSAYSGNGYVAIRHFNCTDEFILNVDDINIVTSGGPNPPAPPTPGAGGTQLVNFENGIPSDWVNTSNYPWVEWTTNPNSGNTCLASGNYNVASSESYIEATVTFVEAGSVEFYSRISSESATYDHGNFYIDGVNMLTEGGSTPNAWASHSYDVAAGTHTFRWSYTKDSSVNSGEDRYYIDDVTFVGVPGGGTGGNGLQEERESEIVWSNCLDKDMYMSGVSVNVLLNSADNPEGTTVDFTNLNEYEQQTYPIAQLVLDETGYYAFESFRRGDYAIKVEHEGYETIYDTVSIWEPTALRYVMIEILYGVENVYVSRTGWAMWDDNHNNPGGNPGPGPGPGGNGGSFSVDFESGMPEGWTVIDGNNDGYTWCMTSDIPSTWTYYAGMSLDWYHGGMNAICSGSYINGVGALTPDEYLVSPQVTLAAGSQLSFWVAATDANYAADHFGVFVSDNGTSNWTSVQEWTLTAKGSKSGNPAAMRDGRAASLGTWYNYTVDLSAYAGQKYIAFRHFNCNDQYIMCLDDIALTSGAKDGERHFEHYKLLCTSIDGVPIFNHNTVHPFCQLSTDEPFHAPLVEGDHYLLKVASVYSTGQSEWSTPVEWQYEPCDHWGPVDEVTVNTTGQGNHIEWVFEHGYNPYGGNTPGPGPQPGVGDWYYYDDGVNVDAIGTGGGNFWWGVMFPAGSYTGNMVTKVSAYDYMAMSGDVTIYQGGTTAPGTAVGQTNVNFTGSEQFVEFEFAAPVAIDPTQNLWVVFYNASGATYPAAVCNNTGDANGRWVSLDGAAWDDLAGFGLDYTFMVRAYIAQGAKGEVKEIKVNEPVAHNNGTLAISGNGPAKNGHGFVKGGEFYTQYAEDGIMLDFFAIDNVDLRTYMLYNLNKDARFSLVPDNEYGQFILTSSIANFMDEFETVYQNVVADFSMLTKNDILSQMNTWKTGMNPQYYISITMDVALNNSRSDNDHCALSMPFCTSDYIEFEAASTDQTAEQLEGQSFEDGCIGSSYNPSWYHMRIHTAGQFVIHMEGHDPVNSSTERDVDFCIWGPFTDPVSPCVSQLTLDKIIDCSYSASYSEDIYLGYPEGEHNHGSASHGTVNYHVPEVGEYYIVMLTNYSRQPCVITFTKTQGVGETDCEIVNPTVDLIGFLITQDGEYLAFAGPDDREYTDIDEFEDHEYCVRPIYPGDMILPDQNFGWSMGCPVCASSTGDCAPGAPIYAEELGETDQVKIWWGDQNPGPGPGGCEGDEFSVNFESGMPAGWTTIDGGNPSGYGWHLASTSMGTGYGHNGSSDCVVSQSYDNNYGPIVPDNYLISPAVTLCEGSTFSFWACAQDASYAAEHFGVAVSDDGVNFGTIQEWTMTAKSEGKAGGMSRSGRAQGNWYQYTVDLSDYAGEGRYVAIRHFNCTDMFYLDVDDIELSNGAKAMRDGIVKYNVYRSSDNSTYTMIGEVAAVAGQTYYEYIDTPAVGTWYYQVRADYGGCESEPALSGIDPSVNYVTAQNTGIDENESKVTLYPNPTNGNVTIEAAGMSRITVVSVLGQVVYDTELDADTFTLNMGQFNAGMYMVRVYTEDGVTVKRVTVMQ